MKCSLREREERRGGACSSRVYESDFCIGTGRRGRRPLQTKNMNNFAGVTIGRPMLDKMDRRGRRSLQMKNVIDFVGAFIERPFCKPSPVGEGVTAGDG